MLLLLLLSTYNYISWHITLYFCRLFYLLGRVFALFVCYFNSRSAFSRFLFATLPPEVLRLGIHNRLSFLYPIFLHKLLILSLIFIHKSSFWVYVVVSIPPYPQNFTFPGYAIPPKTFHTQTAPFYQIFCYFWPHFPTFVGTDSSRASRIPKHNIFIHYLHIFNLLLRLHHLK